MHYMWGNIVAIAGSKNLFFITNSHLERTTFYVSNLRMWMLMQSANAIFFKLYFYHHDLIIITIQLPFNLRCRAFPWYIIIHLENRTLKIDFHETQIYKEGRNRTSENNMTAHLFSAAGRHIG